LHPSVPCGPDAWQVAGLALSGGSAPWQGSMWWSMVRPWWDRAVRKRCRHEGGEGVRAPIRAHSW